MMVFRIGAAVLTAAYLSTNVGAQESSGDRSVMSAVFSSDQVAKGRATHRTHCVSCHGSEAYVGEPFDKLWRGRTVFDFFDALRSTMPNDEPGKLSLEEYIDVTVYILSLNGYPQGSTALPYDENELRKVKIDSAPPPPKTP